MGKRMNDTATPLIQPSEDASRRCSITDEVETHALVGRAFRYRQGRLRFDRGAVRLRQVDAALDPRAARHADRRPVLAQRQPPSRISTRLAARPHPQPGDRLHLPGVQSDRRSDGVRERRAAADLSRRHVNAPERKERVLEALERGRHGASAASTIRRSFRAASSSASRSRARWSASPRSCSPTSRPATSTRRTARPSWHC